MQLRNHLNIDEHWSYSMHEYSVQYVRAVFVIQIACISRDD